MKTVSALRIATAVGKNAGGGIFAPASRLKPLVQNEYLTIHGDGVHHIWRNANGDQFILIGEVVGIRRADGTLSDSSLLRLEVERIESPEGLLDVEGWFVLVKVLRNGGCEVWTDRFGRMDVYWQAFDDGVIVATGLDLLPVVESGGRSSAVGVAHSLMVYGNRPAKKHTLYEGINRLGVDEGIRIVSAEVELLKRRFRPIPTGSYSDRQLDQYADIFLEAVRARASSDCNVVSLSSGWDSTAILASLVHIVGNRKVRAVIGRMRYADRSGVINQFEIDRAQAFADYYGIRLDICDLTYCSNAPELLEKARPYLQSQQFSNLSGISQWILAEFIARTANGDEVIFNGEISDGAHNLGFSQFVTIFHPASHDFREYSDKMASYLYGPTFMRSLFENKHHNDPVWQLFKQRSGNSIFDELADNPCDKARQMFASFFLRGSRLPLMSLSNSRLLTESGREAYSNIMESTYLKEASESVTPDNLYSWYLHLYNSFHWQGATVITRVHAARANGLRAALPFSDGRMIEFLSAMPESWGRGLELKPTKYPLKWMLQNRIDYPIQLQRGPHSYLYDVNPNFSHSAEILFGSSFVPLFKKTLKEGVFQSWLDSDAFDHGYVHGLVNRYLANDEFGGAEMSDLFSIAMHSIIGGYHKNTQ